jgi:hypothetical protein
MVTGIFGESFARGSLIVRGDATQTAQNTIESERLFRIGIPKALPAWGMSSSLLLATSDAGLPATAEGRQHPLKPMSRPDPAASQAARIALNLRAFRAVPEGAISRRTSVSIWRHMCRPARHLLPTAGPLRNKASQLTY